MQSATSVMEDLSEGLQVVDATWHFVCFNTAARRMYAEQGIEVHTLVGEHAFAEAFPEARDTPVGRAWRRAMTQRVVTEAESLDPLRQRSYAVRHFPMPEGGVSTFFRETTRRRRAEEARRNWRENPRVPAEQWQTVRDMLQVRQGELNAAHDELQTQGEERCRESHALRANGELGEQGHPADGRTGASEQATLEIVVRVGASG